MLKKANKWVSVVVALAFVVGLAVLLAGNAQVANAAVGEKVNLDQVVTRLNALGLVQGYPDGTWGLDKNITRAEFAAIVCRALGLESAAQSAKGATQFSDVPADHWASGYINLATGNGILKGYPDGTFKPDANVNYAEAVTMLVRALGYEPAVQASAGTWPNNYLSKGGELGVLDDVSFANWSTAAVRGDVFLMLDNSLDVGIMKQTSYGTEVSYGESDETILSRYLKVDVYKDKKNLPRVQATPRVAIGELKANEVKFDKGLGDHGRTLEVLGGINPDDFLGQQVKVWVNDDDVVVFMEAAGDEEVVNDVLDSNVAAGDTKLDLKNKDKKYTIADGATIYINNVAYRDYDQDDGLQLDRLDDAIDGDGALKNAKVKVILNEDDEIIFADIMDYTNGYALDQTYLVDEVNADDEYLSLYKIGDGTSDELDLSDADNYLIVRDGKAAKLSDLQQWDVIRVFVGDDDASNVLHPEKWAYIVASSQKVSGEVSRVYAGSSAVKDYDLYIDGTKYDMAEKATISTNNNDDIDAVEAADLNDLDGEKVEAYLVPVDGKIAHVVTDADITKKKVGIVTNFYKKDTRNYQLNLFNSQGQKLSFTFDDNDVDWFDADGDEMAWADVQDALTLSADNRLVVLEYKLTNDGDLDSATINKGVRVDNSVTDSDIDKDDDVITLNGRSYRITSDTIIFDASGTVKVASDGYGELKDADLASWSAVEDAEDMDFAYILDGVNVEYMFITYTSEALAAKGNYAVVTGFEYSGDDTALELLLPDGSKKTYVLDDEDDAALVKKADFIYYELNASDKITKVQRIVRKGSNALQVADLDDVNLDAAELVLATKSSSGSSTLKGLTEQGGEVESFLMTSSTVYLDLTPGAGPKKVSGVDRDDLVFVIDTDDKGSAYDYVVITKGDATEDDLPEGTQQPPGGGGGTTQPDVQLSASVQSLGFNKYVTVTVGGADANKVATVTAVAGTLQGQNIGGAGQYIFKFVNPQTNTATVTAKDAQSNVLKEIQVNL
ncbi:MAG: S-layer homology domain-containing protein [Clostridia bacterium]|nr:MAG: S-layer homology domain-containing protein [Clostridia bacterium]